MKQERDLITTQRYVNKRNPPPQTLIEYVRKTPLETRFCSIFKGLGINYILRRISTVSVVNPLT